MAGVLVAAGLLPHLVRRRDERRAEPGEDGLGGPIPGTQTSLIATDDGAELHIVERGSGPPLLLVHGLALDHRTWHHQFLDLTDDFRLIAVDLRGHGRSTTGEDPIGPGRFAADLATVLVQMDLHNTVVVGHSLGGTVIGQLCADHPDLVRDRAAGLVFVDTFASAIAGEGRFREKVSPTLIRVAARMRTRSEPRGNPATSALAYTMARSPFGPHPHPDHVRLTLTMGAAAAPATVSAATVGNIAYDVRGALGAIDLPSLVIRGSRDTLSTERSTAQLSAALAHPEVVVLEGCGHLPMLEDRTRFGAVLHRFAARAPLPSRRGQRIVPA